MKNKQIALLQARLRVLETEKTDLRLELEEKEIEVSLYAAECEVWEKTCNSIIEERDEAQAALEKTQIALNTALIAAAHLCTAARYKA